MSDPADKTDDLIAELAKLMAAAPGGAKPAVTPVPKPAPLSTAPTATPQQPSAPAATPVRIPGMDPIPPKPAAPAATPQAEAPRAPATGTIRIPGMDQPAPVSTSAPVSKFDFGKPVSAAAPIRQEPLSTLSERLAAHDPVPPQPAPSVRIPSSLTPVSENRSFAEGPALSVAKPEPAPAAPSSGSDLHFDFGFAQNPPASSSPPRAVPPQPQPGPPPLVNRPAAEDPIAALIEADMDQGEPEGADDAVEAEQHDVRAPEPAHPQVMPIRPVAAAPAKPSTPPVSPGSARPAASTPIPLKPVSAAPRAPESDRFAISPGVGLNMKPQPGQPLAAPQQRAAEPKREVDESDPMSEIESLIGEAVRVELTPGPVRVQAPQSVAPQVSLESEDEVEEEIADAAEPPPPAAPVVPPLTTQFAPRRANLKDDAAARSAEDAILAAAAASGAEVGRVEPSIGDESPYRRLKVKPQRSGFFSGGVRQYVGMAVAGTLLLAAGLGLYWVLNMGRLGGGNTGAAAPQLTADATPVKEVPTAPAKPATDAAKSPVLAKMDNATPAPSSEQLVSTDQATAAVTRDVTPVADDNDNGLANRKVRTVTVRPDGTIVSGDDAVAGGEELPVERPNVPSVPSSESTNLLGSDTVASASAPTLAPTTTTPLAPGALTDTDSTDVADIAPVIDPNAVAPVPMQFPVRSAASAQPRSSTPTNTSVNALVGAQTPNGQIDLLGGGTPATNATQRVATATPARSTPAANDGGNAAAYVQLSSQPSEADAQASIRSVTAKYGSLFGGSKLVIQQVDLGQKGVRWRVRLPTSSLTDATSICAQIKAQGGDCFATNG
jgi:hypothetical protein